MISQKTILVVEDNLINREILCAILSEQYTVIQAENGQEALDILQTCKDDIALVLLDVIMPVMDGYTFLDRVKADPELAIIPVIVMTQSEGEESEVSALAHGATDFVAKPYRPQVILHRIASIIKLRETAAMVNQFQYDHLTGLYSKEFFYQKAKELLKLHPEKEYDVICSNIENFKLFNDAFGVKAGDNILQELAKLLMDIVKDEGICGRQSGDRFLCLRERRPQYTEELYMGVTDQINNLANANNNLIIKWGIYEVNNREVPIENMCDRAFLAADLIKGQYHKCFAFYDENLRSKLLREQAITEVMENALKEEQFVVYFQPKYNLDKDSLAGAEALVRWNHPELGFVSPGEFIPLFEKNGFITQLDRYVWEKTCRLLHEWKQKGYKIYPVSVNVSRADIYQVDLADTMLELVKKYEIEPRQLHLEITESAYTENAAQIIATVDQLRRLGFVIEMDDFGSGYSSLNMLNQMKLDVLKLDMKFIQSETAKPVDQGILRFIVGLARWMNLSVVAEGVETREQLERLREIGCDYVQGYFFAKPMPGNQFEEMLKRQEKELEQGAELKPIVEKVGKRCIILIDEEKSYITLVRRALGKEYHILEASDVEEVFSYIEDGIHNIVLVILSMTIPDQGAHKILDALGENYSSWKIPVLATAAQNAWMEEEAMRLDADDFACKPHTEFSLRKRVARLLGVNVIREREQRLRDEASQDFLTGILNRRGFQAALNQLQEYEYPVAMYIFDLDDLKKINDTYGHVMGDKMLQMFAGVLKSHTRDGDILSRYGGDEFVIVLKKMSSKALAQKKGNEICDAFQALKLPGEIKVGCTAGMILCGNGEKVTSKLVGHADRALYYAKHEDKGRCCVWDEETEISEG